MEARRQTAGRGKQRRWLLLAAVAIVAAGAGIAIGAREGDAPDERVLGTDPGPAGADDDERARDSAQAPRGAAPPVSAPRLPLPQAVGQTLVMAFDGTVVPEYIHRRLRNGEGAGVILFGANVVDAAQLRRLTRTLQRSARGGALIATDQEGGEIRNVAFAGPDAPQSATATVPAVRAAAGEAARGLRAGGVNVNLAPVADVEPPAGAAGGGALPGRLYPGTPERVAALTAAAVRAHERAGVAATVKHYPGLGRATVNTDDGAATIDAPRTELEAADLEPYRAAVAARAPLVMSGHALYTRFDPRRIASQSRILLSDVLRGDLGFDGVTITDSIEAQAVLDRSDVATAAVRSIAAGNDIVLMTGSGSWNLIYPRLLRTARRSPTFRARIHQSATRVLALKRHLGLRATQD